MTSTPWSFRALISISAPVFSSADIVLTFPLASRHPQRRRFGKHKKRPVSTGRKAQLPMISSASPAAMRAGEPDPRPWNRDRSIGFDEFSQKNPAADFLNIRSEEHTSDLQSLMRISYAVSCL